MTQAADLQLPISAAGAGAGDRREDSRSRASASAWSFITEDGRSLRKAIDWLTPYATNRTAWPYPQPQAPNWLSMAAVARRASLHYESRDYEVAACTVLKTMHKSKEYRRSAMNLQLPPLFDVSC